MTVRVEIANRTHEAHVDCYALALFSLAVLSLSILLSVERNAVACKQSGAASSRRARHASND